MAVRTGSILPDTEDDVVSSDDVRKFVKHAMMQMVVSARTLSNDSEKMARWPQGMTWADFRRGLARKEVLLTFRWTLESPMRL